MVRSLLLTALLVVPVVAAPAALAQSPTDAQLARDILRADLISAPQLRDAAANFGIHPDTFALRLETLAAERIVAAMGRERLLAVLDAMKSPWRRAVSASSERAPDGRLGDASLAARYVDLTDIRPILRTLVASMRARVERERPALHKTLLAADVYGQFSAEALGSVDPRALIEEIAAARSAFGGASQADVEAYVAFWASPDGQVVMTAFQDALAEIGADAAVDQLYALYDASQLAPPPPPVLPSDPTRTALARELAFGTPIGQRLLYHLRTPTDEMYALRGGRTAVDSLAVLVAQRMAADQIQAGIDFYRSDAFQQLWGPEERGYRANDEEQRRGIADAAEGQSRIETPERTALVRRLLEAQNRPGRDVRRLERVLDGLGPYARVGDAGPEAVERITAEIAEAAAGPMVTDRYVDYVLATYPTTDEAVFRKASAFYESPAGAALVDAFLDAVDSVTIPYLVRLWTDWIHDRESGDEVYEVVEQQPELIGGLEGLQQRIRYPREARDAGIEGRVFVQFVVDELGRVTDAIVTRSPSDVLSEAALEAVRGSRFRPGMQRGRPVKVRFVLPINFALDAAPPAAPVYDDVDEPPFVIGGAEAVRDAVVYPPSARADGVTGTVRVALVVALDGTARDLSIEGSPDERLALAAAQAVLRLRYEPARQGGRTVPARLTVEVPFTLDS